MRPTWVEINSESLKSNLNTVRNLINESVSILAVVKADAYGHGACEVSKILTGSGVNMLGVATTEEGIELREAGIREKIVILGGIMEEDIDSVLHYDLTPTVYHLKLLEFLNNSSKKSDKVYNYHLKIDTGMNRLGIMPDQIDKYISCIGNLSNLKLEGVFTHLASAENVESDYTQKQIDRFTLTLDNIRSRNLVPDYFHMANSAAIQNFPDSHGNLVRPGIMIYGAGSQNGNKLQPVMKLKSRIIQIKKHPPGRHISYGGTYVTEKNSVIATLPIGYADGYLRTLSNKAFVSIRGKRAPVVGRVCMDFIMVDVTDIEDVKVGDEVTLFGDNIVSIEDVASWADTISYEIMTLVGKRVHKVFT